MEEVWKDIPGLEERYQVSNMGNVKSLDRICQQKNGKAYFRKGKLLRPHLNNKGYYDVSIWQDGKNKRIRIHTLVAMAFLNHKPGGMNTVVDHVDNNRLNNYVSNLQLTSQRHNSSKDKSGHTSDYIGVSYDKSRGKWLSVAYIKGKMKHIGRFRCELSAAYAYNQTLRYEGVF
jgi:hypothetical protein